MQLMLPSGRRISNEKFSMPLIRDYTHSDKVQRLSTAAEVLFVRLLMKADVAGNFYANPELIKSLCFPLKTNVRTADIVRWLHELSTPVPILTGPGKDTSAKNTALLRMYEVDGKPYLHIYGYGQKLKYAKEKFPKPPAEVNAELAEVEVEEEDKIENESERKNIRTHNSLKVIDTEKELLENNLWLEKVCKSQKIKSVDTCRDWLKKFIDEMKAKENFLTRPPADLKKHFVSWLKIELVKTKNNLAPTLLSENPFWNYCPDTWDEAFYSRILNENYADRKATAYEQKLKRNGYMKQGNGWVRING
jgi:hypothetical protein